VRLRAIATVPRAAALDRGDVALVTTRCSCRRPARIAVSARRASLVGERRGDLPGGHGPSRGWLPAVDGDLPPACPLPAGEGPPPDHHQRPIPWGSVGKCWLSCLCSSLSSVRHGGDLDRFDNMRCHLFLLAKQPFVRHQLFHLQLQPGE